MAFCRTLGILPKDEARSRHLNRLRVSSLRTALDLQAQAQRERANLARRRALECEDEMLRIEKIAMDV